MARDEKSGKHLCPKIGPDWSMKISGPAYTPGMTPEQARSAWYGWLRRLDAHVRPMPRKTY